MDPKTRVSNTLTVLQPGEREICTITRHPIGIIGVYSVCGFVTVLTAVLAFGLAPTVFGGSNSQQIALAGVLVSLIVAAACTVFAAIATKVYWGNTWTLTTDSLTQVKRMSLFKRQSSQLSLENLEDVSSEQNGVLMRMFNFGLIRVETAGERTKFSFPYCPNPNYYAAQILSARETFLEHTNREEAPHREPATQPQPAPPVEPPVVAAVQPAAGPAPQTQTPEPEIDSYEVPGGPDGSV